jgi:hypothetical protein
MVKIFFVAQRSWVWTFSWTLFPSTNKMNENKLPLRIFLKLIAQEEFFWGKTMFRKQQKQTIMFPQEKKA